MAVPAGVALPFDGANASIPANWTRDTAYDGRYALGATAAADGGTNGGQATHTHNLVTHRHTFAGGAAVGTTNVTLGTGKGYTQVGHTHASKQGAYSGTPASGTASNDPPYYEVIFVTPSGADQDVPQATGTNDIIGLFDDTLPTNWNNYTGLNNKWLKGAATDGDAGGTGGSLDAHTHSTDHTHSAVVSNTPSATALSFISVEIALALGTHTHSVSLQSASANAGNSDGQPPYRSLIPATNSTSADTPVGLIGLWDAADADVPANWTRVSSQDDKFLRCASSVGTGGADTHTHTASSAHNHSASAGAGASKQALRNPQQVAAQTSGHSHTWTIGTQSPGLSANTSQTNYPLNRTTIFVKYEGVSFTPRAIVY